MIAALFCSGCFFSEFFARKEDPRIAEKCTPVKSLIDKNYRASVNAAILGTGGGFAFQRSGPELTADQANRQIDIDRVCRTWAVGGMPDGEWSSYLRSVSLASLAPLAASPNPVDKQALEDRLREVSQALAQIQNNSGDADSVAKLATQFKAQLTEALSKQNYDELQVEVRQAYQNLSGRFDTVWDAQNHYYTALSAKVAVLQENLDTALRKIDALTRRSPQEPPPSGGKETNFVPHDAGFTEIVRIYFPRGSFYLDRDSEHKLRDALLMYRDQAVNFEVSGYADRIGSQSANAVLSLKRALVLRDWLMDELNIPARRINATGRVVASDRFSPDALNRVAIVRIAN